MALKYYSPLFLLIPFFNNFAFSAYLKIEDDLMLDTKKISIFESSKTETSNIIGIPEKSFIQIRCEGTKVDSYISTPTYNASNTNVGIRWNTDKPIYTSWNKSTSGTALFAPNPIKFISKILKNDSLVFQWEPYQKQKQAAKFDLNDLKEKIKEAIQKGCNIQLD
mgnify:CR=1 FL=1|tara:strand:- start:112 stop:606 length:495 start_codon:yes stop_codon:yes gene_type:complete